MTLVVNFFGGPGVSKSTNAALLFGNLKREGVNCEMAHEFAKDLTWEKRTLGLEFQPYVIAKQTYRIHRLMGQVDVIITDSPTILGLVYGTGIGYPLDSYNQYVLDQFNHWDTLNVFLRRNAAHHPYNPSGRNQTEEQAEEIDRKIYSLLTENTIDFRTVAVSKHMYDDVLRLTKERLNGRPTGHDRSGDRERKGSGSSEVRAVSYSSLGGNWGRS